MARLDEKVTVVTGGSRGFAAKVFLGGCLLVAALIIACGEAATPPSTEEAAPGAPAATPAQRVTQIAESASYRIEVEITPAITTLRVEEGITTMAQMALMSLMDQGQPVNHHLGVYIYDKSTGALVEDVIPTVKITDQATGTSRGLAADQATGTSQGTSYILACLLVKHLVFPHFGDNIYLPDSTYVVSVIVGDETAVAENIVVKASR